MRIGTKSVLSRQCDWGLFLGTVRLGEVSLSAEGLTAVLERMEVHEWIPFVASKMFDQGKTWSKFQIW